MRNEFAARAACGVIVVWMASRAFAADTPPGYIVVKSTAAGRAMAVHHTRPTTVKDAIEGILNDLDDFFDDDYDVYGAAENTADKKSGIAIITAKYQGKPVRGIVSARMVEKGAMGIVVFCRTDAPAGAWAELTGGPTTRPAGGAGQPLAGGPPAGPDPTRDAFAGPGQPSPQPQPQPPAPPAAPPQAVALREYRFPDNTGSIGLPEGYRPSPQASNTFVGPGGQQVVLGASASVSTPNSQAVQLARQYPVAGQQLFVAPFGDIARAVEILVPQFSRASAARGGPAMQVDHVQLVQRLPPAAQGAVSGVVRYGITKTERGQRVHLQALAHVDLMLIGSNEAWMYYVSAVAAPDDTAEADFPVLLQILGSWRTNDAQIAANTQQWIAGRQQWFAGEQAANATVQQGFADKNAGWRANQVTQSRSMDDFSETMRGVRDIQDTRTGELNPANLGHVDDIVADLNREDPGRYKAIPLRDKLDPKP